MQGCRAEQMLSAKETRQQRRWRRKRHEAGLPPSHSVTVSGRESRLSSRMPEASPWGVSDQGTEHSDQEAPEAPRVLHRAGMLISRPLGYLRTPHSIKKL